MTWWKLSVGIALGALVAACSGEVTPTNPYDPTSLAPAKGKVVGSLAGEEGRPLASPVVTLVSAHGGTPTTASVGGDGTFSVEVPPGDFVLKAEAAGFEPLSFPGVHVAPGDRYDTGALTLSLLRVKVTGSVSLEGGGEPGGAVVQLISTQDPAVRLVAVAGADGQYAIQGVTPGNYVVRASKPSFAPAYAPPTEVTVQKSVDAGELHLAPASAVVRFEVGGTIGAKYAKDPAVKLLLLAFGDVVTDMEVSEDPAFADATKGDTDWHAFAPETSWNLRGDDGAHTVYARFRDRFGITSEAFTAGVVLDRAAPEAGGAKLGDGSGFVRTGAPLALHVEAKDVLSGLSAYAVAADGTVDDEAFTAIDGPVGATVAIDTTVALGTSRGTKTVAVVVRDGAGNSSNPLTISTFVDASAPVPGQPAVVIDGGATLTHDRAVLVALHAEADAADEALSYALATSPGIPDTAAMTPLGTDPVAFELAPGADGPRQVCARFADPAGNVSPESCAQIALDTTGRVIGKVALEGAPSTLAGVTATLTNDADPAFSKVATTDATGAFTLSSVPQGAGYVLAISMSGYRTQTIRGLTVVAGRDVAPELSMLALARGSFTGTVTLNDRSSGEFGGIVVYANGQPYAATTAPDGSFVLRDLPVGAYEIAARLSGYLPATFGTLTAQADRTQVIGTQQLKRQSGTFYICRAGDANCSKGPLDYTGTRAISLYLTSTTATQYRAGFTQDLSAATYQPLVSGQPTYASQLADVDGLQTVWVQYRDGAGNEQAPISATVTLDRAPPTGATVLIDADAQGQTAASTNDLAGHVTLTLAATDALSGLGNIVVSNEDSVFNETPQLFRSPLSWTISTTGDGTKTVYVQFCDRVGNCTAPAQSPKQTIVLDRQAPTAAQGYGVKLSGGAAVTGSAQITVDVTMGADAAAVRFGTSPTLAGTTWIGLDPTQGTSASFPFLLPSGDGVKTVYVQFADKAGNLSLLSPPAFQAAINLDTQPPQGPRIIVPGTGYTNQTAFTLGLGATSGPTEMQVISGDYEDFTGVPWEAYATSKQVQLTSDKTWKFFARFRDAAGNVSSTATAQVVRDTVAPTNGTLSIVEGAYAKNQQVNLRLFATDADEMQISSDGTYDTEPWQAYTTAVAFSLVPVNASPYTVKAHFRDRAGNVSADATAGISVDTQAPTLALTLNGAASGNRTNKLTVTVGATANDNVGIALYELSNASDFSGGLRTTFAPSVAWSLDATAGDGLRTVYARVTDSAGNTATSSATITYDSAPPSGTVTITQGALVKDPALTLALTRDSEVVSVAFGEGALDCASATYAAWPVSNTKAFTLSSGDGQKTVVACFRDAAGNASSASATTTLDTQAPTSAATPVIVVNGFTGTGTNYTTSATLALRFNVSGADRMRVSCDEVLDTEPLVPFVASAGCVLTAGDGVRKVQAEFQDLAGNKYTAPVALVTLDTVKPAVPTGFAVKRASDGTVLASPTNEAGDVVFTWNANASDTAAYRLQIGSDPTMAAPAIDKVLAATSYPYTASEGTLYWRVAAIDAAGNQGDFPAGVQKLVIDRTPPSAVTLSFTTPTETSIVLAWNAPGDDKDANDLDLGSYYELRYVNGNSLDLNASPLATGLPTPKGIRIPQTYTFTGLNRKTLYLMALRTCDDAGNCSGWSGTQSVNLPDQTPPAAITNLTAALGQGKVTLRWSNPGDDGVSGGDVKDQTVFVREGPLVTPADFAAAVQIPLASPGKVGSTTSLDVPSSATGQYFTALKVNTFYSFAVKSADAFANASPPSNVATLVSTKVTGVRPAAAAPGDWVELDGLNFGNTQATVNFNGVAASDVALWTPSLVRVRVPDGAGSGPVSVSRGVVDSDPASFTVAPQIVNVYPKELLAGTGVYLSGTGFGARVATSSLQLGGTTVAATSIPDWSDAGLAGNIPTTTSPGVVPLRVSITDPNTSQAVASTAELVRVWTPPAAITDGTKPSAILGIGANGNTGDQHVLYWGTVAAQNKFAYRRNLTVVGTWEAELDPLNTAPGIVYGTGTSGDIDVDANGAVHMCFTYTSGSTGYVYYRQRTAAGGWNAPVLVYSLSTATAPIGNCRIAAPVNGSVSYPLIVWTVGFWSASAYPSDLYASASANSGATFSAAAQLCPAGAGACSVAGPPYAFEGYPEVAGVDGTPVSWHLAWMSATAVSGAARLRWASSNYTGSASAPYSFGSTTDVTPIQNWAGSFQPVMEQVRGYAGWYTYPSTVLSFEAPNQGFNAGAFLVSSREITAAGWNPTKATLVDADVYTLNPPAVAVTKDGDVSVLVTGTDLAGGPAEHVVRHHVYRWRETLPGFQDVAGEPISGLTAKYDVVAAGGANGTVNVMWDVNASPYEAFRASRTVLPYRDSVNVTVVNPAAGRQFGAPKGVVSTDGTMHTLYFDEDQNNPPTSVKLMYVRETSAGSVLTPVTIASTSGQTCRENENCKDLAALAAIGTSGATLAYHLPIPSLSVPTTWSSTTLVLCPNAASCTNPQTLDTGVISRVSLAVDASNVVHAVWQKEISATTHQNAVFYRRYTASGLTPIVTISQQGSTYEPGDCREPDIVIPPTGTPHIVYRRIYGANALRVRTVLPGDIVSAAQDLYTSTSALERPSLAWLPTGILVTWRQGLQDVKRGVWLYDWIDPPALVASVSHSWTALASGAGQAFIHLDVSDPYSYDYFATFDDLYPTWRGPISWGPLSDGTRGVTDVSLDPRGRVNVFGTDAGPLKRQRYWLGSW